MVLVAIIVAMNRPASAQFFLPSRAAEPSPSDLSSQPLGRPKESSALILWSPLKPQSQFKPYEPITPHQHLRWFITNTIGPSHLVEGVFSSSLGTASDRPTEYGPHWGGFADRYGMRITGIVTGNAMEASLGYALGEDPRYFSARGLPFKGRFLNMIKLTFFARHEDGSVGPAYARFAAISGNNFLSNTWRVGGEANAHDALIRTAEGFAGRMAANAFEEFWPSVQKHVFHSGN